MTPPLSFVWFSCSPDFSCLAESIRHVQRCAPQAARHVWVDPTHPLRPAEITHLLASHVQVRTSPHPHGNLAGLPHLRQQLAALALAGGEGGPAAPDAAAPHVVKLDSDTVVRSLDWLAEIESAAAVGFEDGPDRPWCGPCYALSAALPALLIHTLESLHSPLLQLPPGVPEDAAMFYLMERAGVRVMRLPGWPSPFFAGYDYPTEGPDGADLPAYCQAVIHFGNRDTRPDKSRIAAVMARVPAID